MARRRRPRKVDPRTLGAEVAKQMKSAGAFYHRMTGGNAEWWAPESWVRDHVARRLHQLYRRSVTVEETVRELRRHGRQKVRGRYPRDSRAGRLDIALWNDTGKVRAIVEFKRTMNPRGLRADVRRLRNLTRTRVTKYGLEACFCVVDYVEQGEERIAEVEKELDVECVAELWGWGSWDDDPDEERRILYAVFRV